MCSLTNKNHALHGDSMYTAPAGTVNKLLTSWIWFLEQANERACSRQGKGRMCMPSFGWRGLSLSVRGFILIKKKIINYKSQKKRWVLPTQMFTVLVRQYHQFSSSFKFVPHMVNDLKK